MQHRHLYSARHVVRATNVTIAYQIKHGVVDIDTI
jgi:hypothetical protein